jgi:hypothetical protein
MSNQNEINRLGFDAWMENLIVNCLEDGISTVDSEDMFIRITIEGGQKNFFARAWTADGWKFYEKHIPIPKE